MRFHGKCVLVTGAAGGIGREIVAGFQREGARVAAADLNATSLPVEVQLEGDLSDPKFANTLPGATSAMLGGLDIVCNNAGIMVHGPITQATDEEYHRTMAVNVEAPFRICRAAIPLLAANGGGAIVNTASCLGQRPGANHPLYAMSKAAIAALTQSLGRDHAHQNIRINAVCPYDVDTPMLRDRLAAQGQDPETALQELKASAPLGRVASAREIADVVLFLASDQARYLCGTLIEAHGGKPVT